MNFDVAIVGGGPAGIAAAIQSARLGLSTLLVEKKRLGGTGNVAPFVQNYPGFEKGISGRALMSLFDAHLAKWPVEFTGDEVIGVALAPDDQYGINCTDSAFITKCVIVATGLMPVTLGLEGELPYAAPDFVEHAGKKVLVVGGGDCAFDLAAEYAKKAREVTVCMRDPVPRAMPALVARARQRGVNVVVSEAPEDIAHDVLVTCCGRSSAYPFIKGLMNDLSPSEFASGGIFLAGDIAHPEVRHISTAAGDGIAAAERAYRKIHADTKR